jgi:CRAL/TRIO domain
MPKSALFEGTSRDEGRFFHIQVHSDQNLGVKLVNCDIPGDPSLQFYPGYALVGGFTDDDNGGGNSSSIYRNVLQKGDIMIAVNGHGFRRFAYRSDSEVPLDNSSTKDPTMLTTLPEDAHLELDHAVIASDGTAYQQFMEKFKAVKMAGGDPPLILTVIRYDWNSQCFAWRRFLAARDDNVPAALQLYQAHVTWRHETFPMDISTPGVQTIFDQKAVAQIDSGHVRAVYVNYGSLLQLESAGMISTMDIRNAFVLVTEKLLGAVTGPEDDPRYPSVTHLIDVSGVSSYTASAFRTDILKDIYTTFEPNYPETLHKMILYPISSMVVVST